MDCGRPFLAAAWALFDLHQEWAKRLDLTPDFMAGMANEEPSHVLPQPGNVVFLMGAE